VIPSLLGAGFGALWLVRWYLKRMEGLGCTEDAMAIVPAGMRSGLPFGVTFMAPAFQEARTGAGEEEVRVPWSIP